MLRRDKVVETDDYVRGRFEPSKFFFERAEIVFKIGVIPWIGFITQLRNGALRER